MVIGRNLWRKYLVPRLRELVWGLRLGQAEGDRAALTLAAHGSSSVEIIPLIRFLWPDLKRPQ